MNTSSTYCQAAPVPASRDNATIMLTDGVVSIDIGSASPYRVTLAELHNEADILGHVLHLTERTGVDIATIRTFVQRARGHLWKTSRFACGSN